MTFSFKKGVTNGFTRLLDVIDLAPSYWTFFVQSYFLSSNNFFSLKTKGKLGLSYFFFLLSKNSSSSKTKEKSEDFVISVLLEGVHPGIGKSFIVQGRATFFYNGPATNLKMLRGLHVKNL